MCVPLGKTYYADFVDTYVHEWHGHLFSAIGLTARNTTIGGGHPANMRIPPPGAPHFRPR
jgi:hypothetical protein